MLCRGRPVPSIGGGRVPIGGWDRPHPNPTIARQVVGAAVVPAVVGGAVVGGAVVGGSVVGGAVVGGAVVGGSVVGGAVVGGSVVGGAVVGGAVVGGAVVGGAVVGGPVVGGPVVGGAVVGGGLVPGGVVVGGGLVPGGAGTPATPLGPSGGVVSLVEMGLMDWISPPTPVTIGNPPVGVGGWEEAADDPGGLVPPPPPPATAPEAEVWGTGLSAAPATAPPKLVHPAGHGPWSLRPNTTSRPMIATTVAAHALARRRSEGRQLIR
jgi:hypothetical protein